MSAHEDGLALLSEEREGLVALLSPGVGLFTCARRRGELLGPGEEAGVLLVLGRAERLIVPAGVQGRVRGERPERVHAPVGYRTLLYELEPLGASSELASEPPQATGAGGALVFRSTQSGRFYHRPSPDAPPFVVAGATIEANAPIGLIEVMKTFAQLVYRPTSDLPRRARVLRLLVADGAEVEQGGPLLELEPG